MNGWRLQATPVSGENVRKHGYMQWMLKTSSPLWKAAAPISQKENQIDVLTTRSLIQDLLTDLKTSSKKRDISRGRIIHAKAVESHNGRNMFLANALISMYGKCGSKVEARTLFDSILDPNVVSWNSLLLGYADNGEPNVALELFSKMKAAGFTPNSVTYLASLKSCTSLALDGEIEECLQLGREIHSEIGCHMNHYVQSMLIGMYAKCGRMLEARDLFDEMRKPDVVAWTALLLGYAENGEGEVTLDLFTKMKERGYVLDTVTYVAALKACMSMIEGKRKDDCLERVRYIHLEIGSHLDQYMENLLIDIYGKCGSMSEARYVFDGMHKHDLVSWTALLSGYAENGEERNALNLFSRMKEHGFFPDSVAYVAVLKACTFLVAKEGRLVSLERGRKIHLEIGCHLNRYVQNTLIGMYSKCGSMDDARFVFDNMQKPDVVSWTALMLGYAENGEEHIAVDLFSRMKELDCHPNPVAYVTVFKACSLIGALTLGRKFHSEISNFTTQIVTCLVDFYAKCGCMIEARSVFELHFNTRDITTWTALLSGYAKFGDTDSVFALFEALQDEGLQPDAVTFLCLLLCCSHAGLVEKATEYFEGMPGKYGVIPTAMHYNCMVDVLGRANQLNKAFMTIQKMPCNPDLVTWMTLMGACRKWKNVELGREAFQSLVDMDKRNSSAYVLMANIYGSNDMWEEQKMVLETSMRFGALIPEI